MKMKITKALLGCGFAAALWSCSDNEWNNNELDGFEVPEVTDVQTVSYTMTDDDYSTVASLSANKTLAGEGGAAALKAVGTKHCFSEEISARDYVPAFLSSASFQYFTLTDGSAVKLTYNTSKALPAEIGAIESARTLIVSDSTYQAVWESEDDYIAAFAPSHTAAANLPKILANEFPDAQSGDYVIVNYSEATTDPVFTAPDEPVVPSFTESSVIGSMAVDEEVTINGVVTALCSQGFILRDASGSIFVYRGNKFETNGFEGVKAGDQMVLSGTVGAFNKGLQIANGATWEVKGNQEVTYPEEVALDAAYLANVITRTENALPIYGSITGTAAVSGYNYNIKVAGSEKAEGSIYGITTADKATFVNGASVKVTGYLINIAKGQYCNMVATKIVAMELEPEASAAASRAGADVATEQKSAIYTFNGSKWVVPASTTVLGHSDYQEMGQRYDNLSNDLPAQFLPVWLSRKYAYVSADATMFVAYAYYNGTSTSIRCDEYIYSGGVWSLNTGVTTETSQFVKTGGKWMYDPNVTITLPSGKGIEISTLYYQTCVDWVANNIDKPTGAKYVTSYGNNEYYSGTSAYQGNVDLRYSAARAQYAAGYEGMSDEQVVEAMKTRFATEVMPSALGILHPDADVIAGIDVIYTINFATYSEDKKTRTQVIKFRVVGKGKFEFVECDW